MDPMVCSVCLLVDSVDSTQTPSLIQKPIFKCRFIVAGQWFFCAISQLFKPTKKVNNLMIIAQCSQLRTQALAHSKRSFNHFNGTLKTTQCKTLFGLIAAQIIFHTLCSSFDASSCRKEGGVGESIALELFIRRQCDDFFSHLLTIKRRGVLL